MEIKKVKYKIIEDFIPLKFTNLNKLVIRKLESINKSTFIQNPSLDYKDTHITLKKKLDCTWKDIYKVKLNLKLDFVPGDSVGLLCPNNTKLVDAILKILNVEGDELYFIEQVGRSGFKFEGALRDFFTHNFDFTSLPKKAWLIDISQNSLKRRDLEYLCSKEGIKDYLGMIKNWNNVLDILDTFESTPSLEELLMNCQTIKPRYYSLTNHINDHCEIILCKVENGGRYGHVSDFIHNGESKKLKMCHRESKLFRAVPTKKILCVCTGAAPFMSFLKNKDGDQIVKIIYGFRDKADDLLTDNYNNTEIIKVLSSSKLYVTDYINQNIPEIENFIKEDCLVYVCGRSDMQKNVYDIFQTNFKEIIAEKRLFFDSWL